MKREAFIRNLFFGVEDGLVSTLGFVSGIAVAGVEITTLFLTGIVLIFAEAFSMAAGSFLTAESVRDLTAARHRTHVTSVFGAVVMFVAYLTAGALVLVPYFFAWPGSAFTISVGMSLFALFLLGIFSARYAGVPAFRRGIRTVVLGGGALGLGVFVARWAMNFL